MATVLRYLCILFATVTPQQKGRFIVTWAFPASLLTGLSSHGADSHGADSWPDAKPAAWGSSMRWQHSVVNGGSGEQAACVQPLPFTALCHRRVPLP